MYKIVKWYTICLIGRVGVATESFGLRHALDADHIAAIASERFKQWQEVGEIISTCVSACFLFAIALINLLAMQDTYRALRRQKRENPPPPETVNPVMGQGIVSRLLRPIRSGSFTII